MSAKFSDLCVYSVICMRAVLLMCAQSYLCAFNVVYSEEPNKYPCLLLFLGNLSTLPSPRYLFGPPTPLINFTFTTQFNIGILLKIICVFSEHLPNLGEYLYI